MNYFQLLCGKYQDRDCVNYSAGDIVKSDGNLVVKFGSFRFRRLTPKEIALIEQSESKEPESKDICGKVTSQFPDAEKKGLFIYKKLDGKYFIMNKNNTILMNDISKYKVTKFLKNYKAEQ